MIDADLGDRCCLSTQKGPLVVCEAGLTEQGAVSAERWLATQMGAEHGGVLADLAAADQIDETSLASKVDRPGTP